MFKNKGKIILIIVLVLQLITPLGLLIYEATVQNEINSTETNVILKVDSLGMNTDFVTISPDFTYDNMSYIDADGVDISDDYELLSNSEYKYIVFEDGEDGFSTYHISNKKPDHNRYIKNDDVYRIYSIDIPLEKEYTNLTEHYYHIYDRYNEASNVAHGVCEGPLTEAYVELIIHQNNVVAKNVNINGMELEDYLEACNNGEIHIERFEFNYFDDDFNLVDYYNSLDEDSKQMVDELAGQILK